MAVAYIGAGTDTTPIKVLLQQSFFVYLDSLPTTQHPFILQESPGNNNLQFSNWFYDEFEHKMCKIGWSRKDKPVDTSHPFLIRFTNNETDPNKQRILHYYINTPFPFPLQKNSIVRRAKEDLQMCNTLVVAGFIPHKSILQWLTSQSTIDLVLFQNTCYGADLDEEEYDTLVQALHRGEQDISTRIGSIQHVTKVYNIRSCASIRDV